MATCSIWVAGSQPHWIWKKPRKFIACEQRGRRRVNRKEGRHAQMKTTSTWSSYMAAMVIPWRQPY
eukprot:6506879-Prymnesium_polylepis.1